jgi:sialate O-acetylesterase
MQIEVGLFLGMVLQRNTKGVCDVEFFGETPATGRVQLRVNKACGLTRRAGWATVGKAARGRFAGRLAGLRAGGPYDIELRVVGRGGQLAAQARVSDVLVGDVWLAAGQSNMQGIGQSGNRLPDDPLVRAFYMNDRWAIAREPLHNMWEAIDRVHLDISGGKLPTKPGPGTMISPGVSFAQEMRRLTGVPQGIIACAHGGTSMAQWDPSLAKLGPKSLYGAMLRRLTKNGSKVAGMIWYQGESETNQQNAPLFTQRVKKFIRALRRDCRDAALPVAMVQIGRVVGTLAGQRYWNRIQNEQQLLPRVIERLAIVPAIDLRMSDFIHVSGDEQYRLGVRMAQAMAALKGVPGSGMVPIEVKKVQLRTDPISTNADIVVEFANVAGKLHSPGRAVGFSVVAQQTEEHCIFDTQLEGDKVILKTCMPVNQLNGKSVHYGFGVNPSCNITDEAERSLPVFGPVMFGRPRAMMPFVRQVRVSELLPTGPVEEVQLPKVELKPRTFDADFMNRQEEFGAIREDRLVYFVSDLECSEAMRLAVCLGYDGPVKVWVDGREAFVDPKGTNPAIIDAAKIGFDATPGHHHVIVALNSHKGMAWGIYLRFERMDVSRALLEQSPDQIVLPTFL